MALPSHPLAQLTLIGLGKNGLTMRPPQVEKWFFYNQCPTCAFVFTTALDDWQHHEFTHHIYNEFYKSIDGGAPQREIDNANIISNLFQNSKNHLRVLDFGGGDGGFSRTLSTHGFQVDTFDPFVGNNNSIKLDQFDLVTCFEVMEHVTNPRSTIHQISALLKKGGVVVFSTLVQPEDFDDRGLFWWYVSPRAGHVSIHSKKSLSAIWGLAGFNVASFNDNLHVAYKDIPKFASHLFKV